MTGIVDLEKARLEAAVRRGFRNWRTQFGEEFGLETRLSTISRKTLEQLALGKDRSTFYLFDLIMSIDKLGSGFEFHELHPREKMAVMDRYLFLLDRIRFEFMKRLGWLEGYPGEGFTMVELMTTYERLADQMQTETPALSRDHPDYERFRKMTAAEKEELIRGLIPHALKEIRDHSTTL